ncbi:MAG: hypothetical protein LLG09_04185 [Negativicutes bacterium]|nr:hypothetical protein [Negativicutes bacterium]
MHKALPVAITFITGAIMILQSYLNIEFLYNFVQNYLTRAVTVSTAWAIGLGALNIIRIHGRRIRVKRANYGYSIIMLVTFFIFLFVGLFMAKHNSSNLYLFLYNNILQNLSATMYSVLAFYIGSAAYRSFRVRSLDSTLLLLTSVVVMLGAVPVGEAIWSGFPDLSSWIGSIINTSVLRAMSIGLTLGALTQSMRTLIGIERGHLGNE